MRRRSGHPTLCCGSLLLALLCAVTLGAQQMPDPRDMSGVPLPVGDVATGTVTVRVIRGSFANPIVSQTVRIDEGSNARTATTDEAGRAEFTGLTPGARVKASAIVGGARLESQEFAVPAAGGIRLVLVAADPVPAASPPPPGEPPPTAAPPAGTLVLGDESRFVFEKGEDGLSVFYILQLMNRGGTPVQPEKPVVFDLPAAARNPTVLQGSSPQATVAGRQLQITGPFQPGPTLVQLAYTVPYSGPVLSIEQRLPLTLTHLAVVAEKVGDMRLTSPQIREQRDMPAQGNLYIAGRGAQIAAGEVLRLEFGGMPYHATWPRTVALVLAGLVLAAGAWSSVRAPGAGPAAAQRQELEARRDRLFEELTALEMRHRDGLVDDDRFAEQRREVVAALEAVYAALDDEVALGRAS